MPTPTISLSPACAALLPLPLDRLLRSVRDCCVTAPLPLLVSALDEVCDQLADADETAALTKATHTVLRDLDDAACVPSNHLIALQRHYEPDEDDRPIGLGERAWRDWQGAVNEADRRAERRWRADMVRMLDTVLRSLCAETLQVAA